ncbi:MAG: FlgD immunoglobulin-like domain containing protein [Armatimonadota bacterium]
MEMKSGLRKLASAFTLCAGLATTAPALDYIICWDGVTEFLSPDWAIAAVANPILLAGVGVSGQVNWGASPCGPPITGSHEAAGYMLLGTGGVGSFHSGDDDGAAYFVGSPYGGQEWSYVTIRSIDTDGGTSDARWGENGYDLLVSPTASYRRLIAQDSSNDGIQARLILNVIGGVARYEWRLTNTNTDVRQVGLRHGSWVGFINSAGAFSGYHTNAYTLLPNGRPNRVHQQWSRAQNPTDFPAFVDFYFRQSSPYPSLRVHTGPASGGLQDASTASRLVLTDQIFGVGPLWEATVLPDAAISDPTFLLYFDPVPVGPGQTRRIVYYMTPPWANNILRVDVVQGEQLPEVLGYAVTAEAPQLIAYSDTGTNNLDPNPFFITTWIDNQYAAVNREITLRDVTVTLALPDGITFAPGETNTKTLSSVPPGGVFNVRWQVQADGTTTGPQKYRVSVTAIPGINEVIEGTIMIASTPRANIVGGPQLVGFPWVFASDDLATITGLTVGAGAQLDAFRWDTLLNTYLRVSRVSDRGTAQWWIADTDYPNTLLNGASAPTDSVGGEFRVVLLKGWNLISNPYPYPVQLNQIIATAQSDPGRVLTWGDLITRGWVRSTLYRYDPLDPPYKFNSDPAQLVLPGLGYWVLVNTETPINVFWPPVFVPGLPGSSRSVDPFQSNQRNWRLQLVARGEGESDASNYIGMVETRQKAMELSAPEPPSMPNSQIRLSLEREDEQGRTMLWAQDVRENQGRASFTVRFSSNRAGTFALSWPNIAQIPRNVRLVLRDLQTGQTRDLRGASAHTFTLGEAGERTFLISVEPGTSARPVIGGVQIVSDSRDVNSPVTIQYSVSTSANVTVRILSPAGREVYTALRGRSEDAGTNSVVWNKRDNNGRAVAPGNYIVEILAETLDGQRARVTRPVIVIR